MQQVSIRDILQECVQSDSTHCFAVDSGVFVSESYFYKKLPKLLLDVSKKLDKEAAIAQLVDFGWEPSYLTKGSDVIYGFTHPCDIDRSLIQIDTRVTSADSNVSYNDEAFRERADVRILLDINFAAEVLVNDVWVKIPHKSLLAFQNMAPKRIKNSPFFPARDALRHLAQWLQHSENITVSSSSFLDLIRNKGIFNFRKENELIFAIWRRHAILDMVYHESLFIDHTEKVAGELDISTLGKALHNWLKRKRYHKSIRPLKNGVFVSNKIVFKICKHYAELSSTQIAPKKVKSYLRKITKGRVAYLIDGQRAILGSFIELQELADYFGWSHSEQLLDGTECVLFDDPIYESGQGIGYPIQPNSIARFACGDNLYTVSDHAFLSFCSRAPHDEDLKRIKNADLVNKRGMLQLMYYMVSNAVKVERRNAALQFLKHKLESAEYITYLGWIFVVKEGGVIITCYDKGNPYKAGYRRIKDDGSL